MRALLLCFTFFLGGCASKVPVTFNGQQFNEYLNEADNTSEATSSLHQKWKLKSINGETVMYGISLEDLDLWINLTQKVGEDGYRYTAHAILSSFWGEYDFDQNGEIRVLSQGDDRVLRVASEDKSRIERKFRMLIRDAEAYELSGSELKLYSDQEHMNFFATD